MIFPLPTLEEEEEREGDKLERAGRGVLNQSYLLRGIQGELTLNIGK